jgi:hypothetical protein
MRRKSIVALLLTALFLTACATTTSTSSAPATQTLPIPTKALAATASPGPVTVTLPPTAKIYPAPVTPLPNVQNNPPGDYTPQRGDKFLSQGTVTLDWADSQVIMQGAQADEPAIALSGVLPDPCQQLRVAVSPPDDQNNIYVAVYSVYDPQQNCIMVIKPFTVTVSLGSYASGHYRVYVNGQLLGEFDQ